MEQYVDGTLLAAIDSTASRKSAKPANRSMKKRSWRRKIGIPEIHGRSIVSNMTETQI
jgi:hypothetical protein